MLIKISKSPEVSQFLLMMNGTNECTLKNLNYCPWVSWTCCSHIILPEGVWTCECSSSTKAVGEEGGKMRVCAGRGEEGNAEEEQDCYAGEYTMMHVLAWGLI